MSDDLSKQPNNSDLTTSPDEDMLCDDASAHCIDSLLPNDSADAEIMKRNVKDKADDISDSESETADLSVDGDSEKKPKRKNKKKKDSNDDESKPKKRKKRNLWWLKISIISFVLAAFFSFISDLTSSFGNLVVILLLLVFLIL